MTSGSGVVGAEAEADAGRAEEGERPCHLAPGAADLLVDDGAGQAGGGRAQVHDQVAARLDVEALRAVDVVGDDRRVDAGGDHHVVLEPALVAVPDHVDARPHLPGLDPAEGRQAHGPRRRVVAHQPGHGAGPGLGGHERGIGVGSGACRAEPEGGVA